VNSANLVVYNAHSPAVANVPFFVPRVRVRLHRVRVRALSARQIDSDLMHFHKIHTKYVSG